jgi:hypothetical protein
MAKRKTKTPEPAPDAPLRLEWRSPAELAENPRNWRTHPVEQTAALAGVLAEVGWAGACLYNEATGRLIDGHARRKLALEQGCERVPVLVGSWTEEQERKILATLDPIGAMATADGDALVALLADVTTDSEAVRALLDSLLPPVVVPPAEFPSYDATISTEHQCPRCGYRWSGGTPAASESEGEGDDALAEH